MHFLIEKSTRKKNSIKFGTSFCNASYDYDLGVWCLDGAPFVQDIDYKLHRGTKKDDVETGEDQKGE